LGWQVNKQQFTEVMEILIRFYNRPMTTFQLEGWFEKLYRIDFAVAKEAVEDVTSHLATFPTPAKFMEFVEHASNRQAQRAKHQDKATAMNFLNEREDMTQETKELIAFTKELLAKPHTLKTCEWKLEQLNKLAEKYPHRRAFYKDFMIDVSIEMDRLTEFKNSTDRQTKGESNERSTLQAGS
jgi:DNA repair ATPase RecN